MALALKDIQTKRLALSVLFPALLIFAITRQSLWMDEGFTAWFASSTSIKSFFSTLMGSREAPGDPQMLFYLLYMWGWVKVWGTSEIALRAANIPLAVLLLGALSWASRTLFRRPNAWLIVCVSPFLWFYMNDARPYVALMAFATVSIVAELAYLMQPTVYRRVAPWCSLTALLFAWGSHILGVFLIPALITLALIMIWDQPELRKNFLRDWFPAMFSLLPVFVALSAFFLWASRFGVNIKQVEPRIANLTFVIYEFLGFGGLGPPRTELRESPHVSTLVDYWPWLLIGVVAVAGFGYVLLRSTANQVSRALAASLLVGLSLAFMVAKIAHLQLMGRYVAALFPFLLIFLLSWGQDATESSRGRYPRLVALTALFIAWGISDFRLVLLPQYEKESYRTASSISSALAAETGGGILWAADSHTAGYYGVRVLKPDADPASAGNSTYTRVIWPVHGQAIDVGNWTVDEAAEYVDRRSTPLVLVLSRPDLYDKNGGWRTLVEKQRPTVVREMTEFQIYEWPARSTDGIARLRSIGPPAAQSGALR